MTHTNSEYAKMFNWIKGEIWDILGIILEVLVRFWQFEQRFIAIIVILNRVQEGRKVRKMGPRQTISNKMQSKSQLLIFN